MKTDPLAEIDIVEVAKIAATILTPGLQPGEKIREAYQLLEIAAAVKSDALKTGYSPSRVLEAWANDEQLVEDDPIRIELEAIKKRRPDKASPIPFADFLQELMPQVEKPKEREKRFLNFMASSWEEYGMDHSHEMAAKVLGEYKSKGLPWKDLEFKFVSFRNWWPIELAKQKSKAGKAKKAMRGRVRRKTDKRKGARPRKILRK